MCSPFRNTCALKEPPSGMAFIICILIQLFLGRCFASADMHINAIPELGVGPLAGAISGPFLKVTSFTSHKLVMERSNTCPHPL